MSELKAKNDDYVYGTSAAEDDLLAKRRLAEYRDTLQRKLDRMRKENAKVAVIEE